MLFSHGALVCIGGRGRGVLRHRPACFPLHQALRRTTGTVWESLESDASISTRDITIPVDRQTLSAADSGRVTVGVRPEDLQIVDVGLEFEVDVIEELGADAYAYGRANINEFQDGSPQTLVARVDWRHPPLKGDRVHLAPIGGHALHVFDTESGARLS
jgi:multiple sugar transport system ATP-binding protein